MAQKNSTSELLLEIGTEEIPSAYLGSLKEASNNLGLLAEELLRQALHPGEAIKSYQTPRRMVLHIRGLVLSYSVEEVMLGPKKEICYAPDGKPTPALEGFLKRHQGTLKEVAVEEGRLVIRRKKRVITREALKGKLPELIRRLGFPKMMRWDGGELRFPRPIRSLLCLYDGQVLRFRVGNLEAGGTTCGSGPDKKEKRIARISDYFSFLKREGILLETCAAGEEGERSGFIRSQVARLVRKLGGFPERMNEALLVEVTNLVERPTVFFGRLSETYLRLPKEILVASLSKYQRLFSVEKKTGELLPYFIACANGRFASLTKIKRNYEQVLNARLEDAGFFYAEDTKTPLAAKRDQLKLLVYHQRLGTMYDKSERMRWMASRFAKRLRFDEKELDRACELAKNDLVTEMVKEFPSLQGSVGSYYAKRSDESEAISQAIREQYLPKGDLLDELPKSPLGCAVSFLEKLDHLVGCFYAGESPTGSRDPYGLRRAANAIFKIVLNQTWQFSLTEMIQTNSGLLEKSLTTRQDRGERLLGFLKDRLKAIFREEGFREDLIEAVVADVDDSVRMREKLVSLRRMMETQKEHFLAAFKVVERTHNILKPVQSKEKEKMEGVRPDLFQDEIEKRLWAIYNKDRDSITRLIGERAWEKATRRYGEVFFDILHQFFEKVLVNVEDEGVRRNRLAMMKEINELYTEPVADLSKLMMAADPNIR